MPEIGFEVVAVVDQNPAVLPPIPNAPLYSGPDGFARWRAGCHNPVHYLVATGGATGATRIMLHQFLRSQGLQPARAVHPTAYVAHSATVGAGGQVLAGAVVGAEARLGIECIVNTRAGVDHECVLGDGVHVGPGATLAGCVRVGDRAFIGAGAVVLPRVWIGADAVVGAGAVVTRNVAEGTVVLGVPARERPTK